MLFQTKELFQTKNIATKEQKFYTPAAAVPSHKNGGSRRG
jgi:hypothetical protein